MNHRKNIFIICLLVYTLINVRAQDPIQKIWSELDSINTYTKSPYAVQKKNPWSFHSSVGTSVGYSKYFGSSMNLFIAPNVNYAATERLSFHAGVMAFQSLPVTSNAEGENPFYSGYTGASLFVAASYQLTNNLIIHGAGIKSLVGPIEDLDSQNFNFQDISIGATYNFGNFSVGASFHKSGRSYMNSPFGYLSNPYSSQLFW